MADIFISYRRNDTGWPVLAIYEQFEQAFGTERVFLDRATIKPGDDFASVIRKRVSASRVLLAVIGPGWLSSVDDLGNRRLAQPTDLVRIEIAEAIRVGLRLIPVLIDGARPLTEANLPDDLKPLALRHAYAVRSDTFRADVANLIEAVRVEIGAHRALPVQVGRGDGTTRMLTPGEGRREWFRDVEHGPELVIVPPGIFAMGSDASEPMREPFKIRHAIEEAPVREVSVGQPFAIGRFTVTRAQFATFIHETGHDCEQGASVPVGARWRHEPTASWREPGFEQDHDHPVVCISWKDAKAYVAWLSSETSKSYRLLSEAEWEYAARADTTAPFWFGNTIAPTQANFDATHAYGIGEKGAWLERTVRVSDYSPNPWGLYQAHGNVWEWCEDPWHNTYVNAPGDSAVWLRGADEEYRVIRGGSWHNPPWHLRSANRFRHQPYQRLNTVGLRIARSL